MDLEGDNSNWLQVKFWTIKTDEINARLRVYAINLIVSNKTRSDHCWVGNSFSTRKPYKSVLLHGKSQSPNGFLLKSIG